LSAPKLRKAAALGIHLFFFKIAIPWLNRPLSFLSLLRKPMQLAIWDDH